MNANLEQIKQEIITGSEALSSSKEVYEFKKSYLDGKTETVTGTRNFVVVKAKDANGMWIHGDGHDYAECYHFVNGAV